MQDIQYEKRDGIAFITLSRPQVLNALRRQTYSELAFTIKDFVADDHCKVLVLTGEGRAFCAGQDLKDVPKEGEVDSATLSKQLQVTQDISRLLYESEKPSIAAINGFAIGAGIEIPLSCSIRVAANNSRFRFPEIKRGLFQTNGSTYLLPRIVGLGRATHMLLTGEEISAEAALACGLVSRLVNPDELLSVAEAYATDLASTSDASLRLILRGLNTAAHSSFEEALEFEVAGNMELILK